MFIGTDLAVVDEVINLVVAYHDHAYVVYVIEDKVKIEEVVTIYDLVEDVEQVEMVHNGDVVKHRVLVRKQNIPFPVIWDTMEHGNESIKIVIYVSRITRVGKEYEEIVQSVKKLVEVGINDDRVIDLD